MSKQREYVIIDLDDNEIYNLKYRNIAQARNAVYQMRDCSSLQEDSSLINFVIGYYEKNKFVACYYNLTPNERTIRG